MTNGPTGQLTIDGLVEAPDTPDDMPGRRLAALGALWALHRSGLKGTSAGVAAIAGGYPNAAAARLGELVRDGYARKVTVGSPFEPDYWVPLKTEAGQ